MEELNQFLNSVESSARRILKQQNKKQHDLLIKERAALVRANRHGSTSSSTSSNGSSSVSMSSGSPAKGAISRDELKATYSSGGALIVQAPPTPTSPLKSPSHRSESDDAVPTYLPRLLQHATGESGKPVAMAMMSASLPAIDSKKQAAKDAAVDVARKMQRDKRAADKIMNSPLYKAMAKTKADVPQGFGGSASVSSVQSIKKAIHEVDNINLLLKKLGMRDGNGSSPSSNKRADHAVEKRMCNACWASPDKVTGCEHHARILPSANNNFVSSLSDEAQLLRQMELQGPTSWLSGDLYVKFRSERDRESLWRAFCRLQDAEREREQRGEFGEKDQVAVVPLVTRHPICDKYYTQIELENLHVQAATRRRNQTKTFVLDVNHIWLTNLDHFNDRLVRAERRRQRRLARQRQSPEDTTTSTVQSGSESDSSETDDGERMSLRDRRDETAIREGYSQIQSISTSRALQNAVFPAMDPSTSSFAVSRQGSVTLPTSPPSRRRKRSREPPFKVAPLTLLVCGDWDPQDPMETSSLSRVPGVALVGTQPVLWWNYPHDDPAIEYTKAVSVFARSKTLSSTNAILVKLVLAIDAPLLSPLWFAWRAGSKAPPPQLYEPPIPSFLPPQLVSHCLQPLLSMKLQTRIDTLLPGTIVVLNSISQGQDFTLDLDEPYAHRRFWPERHERDALRQWWLCSGENASLSPNYEVDPQPCSVLVALPNATSVGGRFTWHALDTVRGDLNRPRREKDYVYILENKLTCGSNGPLWFVVSMAHETMKAVSAAKLSAYLKMLEDRRRQQEYEAKLLEIEQKIELGRLQLEAKRQEQKRIEQELSAKAARAADRFQTNPMGEPALAEWELRLDASVVTNEQVGWQSREIMADQSHVVFYYALNEALPRSHRFAWEKPMGWPEDDGENRGDGSEAGMLTSRSNASTESDDSQADQDDEAQLSDEQRKTRDAIAQMASALLADEKFLHVLKAKLGLHEDKDSSESLKRQRKKSVKEEDSDGDAMDPDQLDLRDHMIRVTEEQDRSKASLMAAKMARLHLPANTAKLTPSRPGEGWKRLKDSKLPPNFARSVYGTHTEGPRSVFINQPNHSTPVGMIDPREASPYEPPEFIPELRVLLIPRANADLQEKKLQWAEYLATQPSTEISGDKLGRKMAISMTQAAKDTLFEKDPADSEMTMEQLVAKAVLCARNNNLQGLEDALEGGCEVNARDNHGNTLFILVCQQGNKKIAKFLMRRHADINLQNLNGNTALHYLIEYKHTELAEYVKSKGATDTIQNAAGLTCYEGLSMDQAEAL